jgi:lysophospholipase L1-like esterase
MVNLLLGILLWCNVGIPNGKIDILLIGDSLSHRWSWSDGLYRESDFNVTRITKIGSTTDWGYDKLRAEYTKVYPPHILILYMGANDVWGGGDIRTPIKRMGEMIRLGNLNCGWVILVSGVETKNLNYTVYQSHLEKLRGWGVWIIPTLSNEGYLRSDGIHLTPMGNDAIGNEIMSTVRWIVKVNPILGY